MKIRHILQDLARYGALPAARLAQDEEEVSVLGVFYTIVAVIGGTLAEVEFETCEGSHDEASGAGAGR